MEELYKFLKSYERLAKKFGFIPITDTIKIEISEVKKDIYSELYRDVVVSFKHIVTKNDNHED